MASTYKGRLRRALAEDGWEVEEVVASDLWWAEEHWRVRSRRSLWGFEVVLTFEVDPLWEGQGSGGRPAWAVAAREAVPEERLAPCLARLVMSGRFDEALARFVAALGDLRNARQRGAGAPPG
jgi:hypothetical protein